MTTFTDDDKKLIKEIRERIGSLDVRDNIERRAYEIALASLAAEPVAVNDDMAYAFHHALSDSSLGSDEIEEIKTGLRAALANVSYTTTQDGWISCSDAVPAEYCNVILCDDLGNVFPGSWDKVFCPTRGGDKPAFVDKDGVEVESSTHWMPLPEPPQEVSQ